MKLGKRHMRRGHLAKVHEAKRSLVARMLAAPPERPTWKPSAGIADALHGTDGPIFLPDLSRTTPWSEGEPSTSSLDAITRGAALVASDGFDFGGSFDDVAHVREGLEANAAEPRPFVIALDYFVNVIQLDRARDNGADAVLLIARLVSGPTLSELIHAARARGLEPIVECATREEAALAQSLEVRVAAVSLRDRDNLRAFEVDPELATALDRFERRIAISADRESVVALGSASSPASPRFDAVFVRASC